MATVGEAIAATLIAQWTAAGGTQPDPIQYLVERPEKDPNPTVADAVYVWLPLRRKFDPVDVKGTYRNVTYTIRIVCHTKTSSARQKEIENEVDRILNSGTVITGATKQTVKEINDVSNRTYSVLPKYISEIIVEVFTAMEVSATAYGTGTTSTFETDELTVNTSIAGSPTATLGATTITDLADVKSDSTINIRPSGDIDDYIQFLTSGNEIAIKRISGRYVYVDSDDTYYSGFAIRDDASNYVMLRYHKTNHWFEMYTPQSIIIAPNGTVQFRVGGDADDYWYFSTVGNIASLLPVEDKVHNVGSAALSADHMYSDDFDNTSPFKEFKDPIKDLKKIKSDKEKKRLDYTSLPDFVRTHTRDPKKNIIENYIDDSGNEQEKVIERAPKDVIEDEGWSINRMVVFLYQVCQKQQERIEALEVK